MLRETDWLQRNGDKIILKPGLGVSPQTMPDQNERESSEYLSRVTMCNEMVSYDSCNLCL